MAIEEVIEKMKRDWSYVCKIFDNPSQALANENLSDAERAALESRDARQLLSLGIDIEEIAAALSGCHHSPSTVQSHACP
jgi:hypothetical protein